MFALVIFGSITVGLALLSRPPDLEGWARLLVDVFAMLISSVIIFLLVHIYDLQRERDERKLEAPGSEEGSAQAEASEPVSDYRKYRVRFLDTAQRSFDQWLSVIVGGAIVITYTALLAHKWLGWFG